MNDPKPNPADRIDGHVLPEQTKTMAREPRSRLSREDVAKIEIGHTDVHPATAWALVAVFLGVLFAVPVAQHITEIRAGLAGERPSAVPQAYDIFTMLPASAQQAAGESDSVVAAVFTANRYMLGDIDSYEEAIKAESVLTETLVPPAQYVMRRYLGAGNETALLGRRGWLFYRPGVDYLTGPGFLDTERLAAIEASGSEWQTPPQPDPRKAIRQFHRQLQDRGIELIVMPTPVKPVIHPEMYSARLSGRRAVQNRSYQAFLRQLRAGGIAVFDPTEALMQPKRDTGQPQYLKTDTHWRPAAMEAVAAALAETVRSTGRLDPAAKSEYRRREKQVTHTGDVAVMLNLPEWQTLFPPETVTIRPVAAADGRPWSPSLRAEVLLLGDSFTNIYSLAAMNWGASAGLAEQLAFCLQAPVDRIARNDAAAHATRQELRRALARGQDRLAGKKVVIWQFAVRELAFGDWKLMELHLRQTEPRTTTAPADGRVVEGVVAAASAPRDPQTVYPDYLRQLHVKDLHVTGRPLDEDDIVVYVWSLRDGRKQPAYHLQSGDRVRLRLHPWKAVTETIGRLNRSDLDDVDLMLKPPWWAEDLERP